MAISILEIMKKKIVVSDVLNSSLAVATESGENVYTEIIGPLLNKETVILDFSGIKIMTTAFLNAALGQLYSTNSFTSEFLNEHLELINVQEEDKPLFAMVVERAKEYFRDKEGFENSVNEHLDD